MPRNLLVGAILTLIGVGGGYAYFRISRASMTAPDCPHGLVGSKCPVCDPSLLDARGWCAAHGVPESVCTRCSADPELVSALKAAGDWCAEHDVPESLCAICKSARSASGSPRLTNTTTPAVEILAIDEPTKSKDVPRAERTPSVKCSTQTLRIRFATKDTAGDAGLAYETVVAREVTETVEANASIVYDGNRYAHLASRASGVIHEVRTDLGDRVQPGTVLAVIDSVALGTAKAEYLQALALVGLSEKNHEREKRLFERRIASESEVLEAETRLVESRIAVARAKQQLKNLGLSDTQIREAAESEDTSSLLEVKAPFEGVVVERSAVSGEVVDTHTHLFAIADTSRMWAMIDI